MVGIFGKQQLINPLDLTTHNPDDVANGVKLSREKGGDPFGYAENKDDIANNEKLKAWSDFVQKSPKGSSYLISNPVVAAMTHDDLDNLGLFESVIAKLNKNKKDDIFYKQSGKISNAPSVMGGLEYNALVREIAKQNPFMMPNDVQAFAASRANVVSGAVAKSGFTKGNWSEDAANYLKTSGLAGVYDLSAAGAKLFDSVFGVDEQALAGLYKDNPEMLQYILNESSGMAVNRFAKRQTAEANRIMQEDMLPSAIGRYQGLEYATTDSEKSALLSPIKVVGDALRSLPSSMALMLTAVFTRGAAIKTEQQAIAQGMTAQEARKQGVLAAQKMAVTVGGASEGLMGYAQQANQTRFNVDNTSQSILEQSEEYKKLLEDGYDPYTARVYLSSKAAEVSGVGAGLVDAMVNAAAGKAFGNLIANDGGTLLSRIGKGAALESSTELFQSGGEQLSENFALKNNINPNVNLSDHVVESMIQGFAVGGLTGGVFAGMLSNGKKIAEAEAVIEQIKNINQLSQASKVLQRDSSTFHDFVESVTEEQGAPTDLYIDAQTLAQSGIAEQLASDVPSVAEQLPTALASNGVVRISVADYASKVANQTYAQSLINDLRTDPESFSKNEANNWLETEAAKSLEQEITIAANASQQETAFDQSKTKVKQAILDNLNQVNRFSKQVNEPYATLMTSYFSTRARNLGQTPEQVFNDYAVKIAGKVSVGNVLGQKSSNRFSEDNRLSNLSMTGASWERMRAQNKALAKTKSYDDEITIYRATIGNDIRPDDFVAIDKKVAMMELKNVKARDGSGAIIEKKIKVRDLLMGNDATEFVYFPEQKTGDNNTFDPTNPNILNQGDMSNRGSFDPSQNIITLLQNADLSTFLHESVHFFLETDVNIAMGIVERNDVFSPETMSKGELQHIRDVSALLKAVGLEGDIQQQLTAWQTMSFEEKRVYHEKVAEMGERYFFEGRSPSIELNPVFQRFRSFMISVYRSIKEFLRINPDAGQLSNEVRAVFDRMIATEEEIAIAEKARSILPVVGTAEDMGMTEQEFADYQAQGKQATEDAIAELQSKGLLDMKWLSNARAKELKRLQKLQQQQRAEIRRSVRTEVYSEPVYKAWLFLTNRLTEEDKLPSIKPKSSITVDNTQDSLFTAIAKLGGIKFGDVVREWGIDSKESIAMPVFGKPVLHKSGGLSIDAMATRLAEEAYLSVDIDGKYDLAEFEERFKEELRGNTQYSVMRDYSLDEQKAGSGIDLTGITAARFDYDSLMAMDISKEVFDKIVALNMTRKNGGIHPDFVAEYLQADGWQSGAELVNAVANSNTPQEEIERRTDQRMMAEYAELSTPENIQRAADAAIHNLARAKFLETEYKALSKALKGDKNLAALPQVAKELARRVISRQKIRNIRPSQYASAEARAARAFDRARNVNEKITEKKNQIINFHLAREAYLAQDEVKKGLRYLSKFNSKSITKRLDRDYLDQIEKLLEQHDFRQASNKEIDRRKSLAEFIKQQEEIGLTPDIDQRLIDNANLKHYKEMTIDEFNGLIDAIKQIEHLGRLKTKLMNAAKQRNFEKLRTLMLEELYKNKQGSGFNREPANKEERLLYDAQAFFLAHIKASSFLRVFDNGKDGGVWHDTLLRTANESADKETILNHEASLKLTEIFKPLLKDAGLFNGLEGKGTEFVMAGKNRTFNKAQRLVIALNMGNAGNMQRLLDGEGWSIADVQQIIQTFNASELDSIQQIWDFFESYRPQVAELERNIYGKEPEWIEAIPITVQSKDGQTVTLRGGYYPVKYDKQASSRAEELASAETAKQDIQGAYSAANVRRSFAKTRSEQVVGRPLSYDISGLFMSTRELVHYLSWAEWVIDAQRVIRDPKIKDAIREKHGGQVLNELKKWVNQVAMGDQTENDSVSRAFSKIRANVSIAGLGFNVMTGVLQLTGFVNGLTRNGIKFHSKALARLMSSPLEMAKEIKEKSPFMDARTNTMFQELNENLNKIRGTTGFHDAMVKHGFTLIRIMQQQVDVVTWSGAYEKAIFEGHTDDKAIAIADQVVRDTQGSGLWHDLSEVQRNKNLKLFTVFYNYMNTVLNAVYTQSKTAPNKQKQIADILLLTVAVPAMTAIIRNGFQPDGEDDDDWLFFVLREIVGSGLGLFVGLRELQSLSNLFVDQPVDYSGTTGTRAITDLTKFAEQAKQGEADEGFTKASINLAGSMFGIPSAQINKTIQGANALDEGKTDNVLAVPFGYRE